MELIVSSMPGRISGNACRIPDAFGRPSGGTSTPLKFTKAAEVVTTGSG